MSYLKEPTLSNRWLSLVHFDNNVDGEVEKASVLVARKLQLTIHAPTVDAHTSECPPMAHAARDRGGWGHYPLYLRHARRQCQRWTRRGILEQLSNIVQ